MDFRIDNDGDIDISTGDFIVENSDLSHIESILVAQKGEWKQYPMLGVGITNYLNAPLTKANRIALEKDIKLQLESDAFKNIFVEVEESGKVNLNADKNE